MSENDIYLPALRGRIGDWRYYVTCLSFTQIAARIRPADEIHKSESLNELIQRELSSRSRNIARYLLSQDQRFFSSIVVGVYGGSPEWLDISLMSSARLKIEQLDSETVEYIDRTLGLLRLTGREKLFAMDGQHRVEAIRQAIADIEKLGDANRIRDFGSEEVSVVFVGHDRSEEGLTRTRRLFSTLNKYAKAVSKGEIIALDEDDAFAIVTRRLIDNHPLFKGKRSSPEKPDKQTSISASDKHSFTSILTVYDVAMELSLNMIPRWTKRYLTVERPSESVIDEIYDQSSTFWDHMINNFPPIRELADSDPSEDVAGKYRTPLGGHMLFRPVGQMAFARAIRRLTSGGNRVEDAIRKLAELPYDLASQPWNGVLWDPVSKKMLPQAANRDLATLLLIYYGGYEIKLDEVLKSYRAVTRNIEAELPILSLT